MQGRVIKGIAGFYYVQTEQGVYECKAKGIFRKMKIKIIPGDYVTIEILSEEEKKGNIETLLERRNELIRPVVSNVDQALIIFATKEPQPNFNLLDRMILLMREQNIDIILCFNKCDLISKEEKEQLEKTYRNSGCKLMFTSTKQNVGIEELKKELFGKTTVLAGPSGVGKSSTINLLQNEICMETGAVSEKISRGKHTTRHAELIAADESTYLVDTPGFSSLYTFDIEKEELKEYYEEFLEYNGACRFLGCLHYKEPDCAVKEQVEQGKISKIRYENYIQILEEIKDKKKY